MDVITSIGHGIILLLLGIVTYFLKRTIADLDNLEAKIETTKEKLDDKLELASNKLDERFQGIDKKVAILIDRDRRKRLQDYNGDDEDYFNNKRS